MSIYNDDELVAPQWLNEKFIEDILQQDSSQDEIIKVTSLTTTPASFKGDHYASIMFRVHVKYVSSAKGSEVQHRYLIVKAMPDDSGTKQDFLSQLNVFETEISMYKETLPMFQNILAQHGDLTKFGPNVVFASLEPHKVIIFEDLCDLGYACVRGRTLSMDEIKPILLKLAKMHAVGYMLGKNCDRKHLVTKYQEGMFSNDRLLEHEVIRNGINNFIEMLESNVELRCYAKKIREMQPDLFQSCMDLYKSHMRGETDEIFVLNHGDFHTKNLMYKFNEVDNHLEDIMMVDFQLSVFAPSSVDLVYATYMLLDADMRLTGKRNEMMHYYFENFIATLQLIGYKGQLPKYSQLQISFIKHRHLAIFLVSTFLPMVYSIMLATPEDIKDLDPSTMMDNEDDAKKIIHDCYNNPGFVNELKHLLPIYLNAGLLD